MGQSFFYFIMSVLATWRITHLLSKEDGPFDIIYKIKKMIGSGFLGSLLSCFYCTSIWIALPFGCWVGIIFIEKIICWMAISGAACLLQKIIDNTKPPEYFED